MQETADSGLLALKTDRILLRISVHVFLKNILVEIGQLNATVFSLLFQLDKWCIFAHSFSLEILHIAGDLVSIIQLVFVLQNLHLQQFSFLIEWVSLDLERYRLRDQLILFLFKLKMLYDVVVDELQRKLR